MRDEFEYSSSFKVAADHTQPGGVFFTNTMQVKASTRESLDRQSWQSSWQQHGWLKDNPLVSHECMHTHYDDRILQVLQRVVLHA